MIDVVYPLGTGSKHDNMELRYSLRSLQKHISDVRRVYVVGERPEWIRNVEHIPWHDRGKNKELSIADKIYRSFLEIGSSDEQLMIHDDHFILRDHSAEKYPFFYDGKIEDELRKTPWYSSYYRSLRDTDAVLKSRGWSTWNFDVHTPIRLSKRHYIDATNAYNWDWAKHGFVLKSLVMNTKIKENNGEAQCIMTGYVDVKLRNKYTLEQLRHMTKTMEVLSIADRAINDDMIAFLEETYPEKSIYEQ